MALNRPGIEWFKLYSGMVVQNDDSNSLDKRKLARIQVRVPIIMDGIEDEHLPWAIPMMDYSMGESSDWGKFDVPAIGSKVCVAFQQGSILHPVYLSHHVDEVTVLEEADTHYPKRKVILLPNKLLLVIDTENNELLVRNPGRMSILIQGDADLTVTGNLKEVIHGNRHTVVRGDSIDHVKGNRLTVTDKDAAELVTGNKSVLTKGNLLEETSGQSGYVFHANVVYKYDADSSQYVGGNFMNLAKGTNLRFGSTVHDNPAAEVTVPNIPAITLEGPKEPQVDKWEGVRWDTPDKVNGN